MLLSTLLLASTIALGPETPLGRPALQPGGGDQFLNSVASNGHDFLATWDDLRAQTGTSRQWIGHIDATGHVLEPAGHPLGTSGVVTAIGSNYLLVNDTSAQMLDENGRPAAAPVPMHFTITPSEAASNGTTVLAVSSVGVNVDTIDGRLISAQEFAPSRVSTPVILPSDDYAFVIAAQQCDPASCEAPIVLTVVDGSSGAVRFMPLHDVGSQVYDVSASATSDGAILVAWIESNGLTARYAIVDASGHVLVAPVTITTTTPAYAQQPVVGWDGHEFLILIDWTPPTGDSPTLRGYRVSASGQLLDPDGFVLTSSFLHRERIARAANAVLVAWDEVNGVDFDVVGRVATSFDAIANADTNVLAMSAQTQQWPRVASGGSLAIWREVTKNGEIHSQSIGGREEVVANSVTSSASGAVACGRSNCLVAWTSLDPKIFILDINVKRVALDGTPIDQNPIVIAQTTPLSVDTIPPPAVAYDGTNFLVVWSSDYDLQAMRVSDSGTPLDPTPIAVSNLGPHNGRPVSPRVVWDGAQYVVGWIDLMFLNVLISPVPPIADNVYLTRVSSAGSVLAAQPLLVWNLSDAQSFALATNPNGVTAMWIGYTDLTFKQQCLWASQADRNLALLTSPKELLCATPATIGNPPLDTVDVAWSGNDFVAVWHDAVAHDVKAQRFGATLLPLDAQPFEVSLAGSVAMQPSIAATAGGTAIAYVRLANEPQYAGVPRAFVRTLARSGVVHGRAAGR